MSKPKIKPIPLHERDPYKVGYAAGLLAGEKRLARACKRYVLMLESKGFSYEYLISWLTTRLRRKL